MKKLLMVMLAAVAISTTCFVYAQEDMKQSSGKDECLLLSKGCKDETDSIQQRVRRINAEIKKGKKVYSAAELKELKRKLKDVDDFLKNLEKSGGH